MAELGEVALVRDVGFVLFVVGPVDAIVVVLIMDPVDAGSLGFFAGGFEGFMV